MYNFFLMILVITSLISGCVQTIGYRNTNNKFVYPNSNITPLGNVSSQKSWIDVISAKPVDKKNLDEMTQQALQQKGGDILINSRITTKVTTYGFPYGFIWFPTIVPIYKTELVVEGMAAKMEIGMQDIGQPSVKSVQKNNENSPQVKKKELPIKKQKSDKKQTNSTTDKK